MKLQCDVCDKEEAEVLCCADEAVLCKGCDAQVHAANKLSQKHHRLFLLNHLPTTTISTSSSQLPLCDICQERKGYVFCLEDRALLCRDCDVSTHAATSYAFTHQRFLISGTKVALDSSVETSSSNIGSSRNNHHTRSPMPVDCSFDFPASEATSVAARKEMEAASADTAATFPLTADETGFKTETNWALHDHIYDTDDFIFYDFSDVASSKIDDQ